MCPRRSLLILASLLSFSCAGVGSTLITSAFRLAVIGGPSQPHRDVSFESSDGLTLRGWRFEPQGDPKGLVIFLHGKDANRVHLADEAHRFTERGFVVLTYDHRAHGASDGKWVTYGVREREDVSAAIDALGITPVILIGESLGAGVALQAAARDPRVVGVVAAASFSDARTIIRERTPFFFDAETSATAVTLAEEEAGFQLDDANPLRDVADITVPVLLLHGTADTFISPDHSQRLFDALSGPKELVPLDGVDHPFVLENDRAWESIERWFDAQRG